MNKRILLLTAALTSLSACSYMPSWMGGATEEKPKLQGERKVALATSGQLKIDEASKNAKITLPAVVPNTNWSQHSGEFTAANGNLAGGGFDKETSVRAGNGNDFSHSLLPRPVVYGGVVFVMDAAGVISAHDAGNIDNIRWKSEVVADEDEDEVIGGGLAVEGGVLYATTGQGQVAAINVADGKKIWQKNFGVPMRGSPHVAGDAVIVITIDSRTYALSSKSGDVLWEHRGIDETAAVMNSVSPAIAGDNILVPYSSGELFALSINGGRELWSETLLRNKYNQASDVFTGIGGDPVVDGEVVFVTSNSGITIAIDMINGKNIWQQQVGSLNTPWLAGNELFLLTADNVLVDMVKQTGKIRWLTALDSYEDPEGKRKPITWRGPVLIAGKLVVVSSNGKMVFVAATTGKITETKSIPSNILTAPVIAGGRMYLLEQDATLYSFQ